MRPILIRRWIGKDVRHNFPIVLGYQLVDDTDSLIIDVSSHHSVTKELQTVVGVDAVLNFHWISEVLHW